MTDTPDDREHRATALAQLDEDAPAAAQDPCGPKPQRPNYYSPQEVRDRWYAWKLCKLGG